MLWCTLWELIVYETNDTMGEVVTKAEKPFCQRIFFVQQKSGVVMPPFPHSHAIYRSRCNCFTYWAYVRIFIKKLLFIYIYIIWIVYKRVYFSITWVLMSLYSMTCSQFLFDKVINCILICMKQIFLTGKKEQMNIRYSYYGTETWMIFQKNS